MHKTEVSLRCKHPFSRNATPNAWRKATGIRSTRIGRGYYNYRSHCYVRR